MARIWIGLAVALWLGIAVVGADETGKAQRRLPRKPDAPAAQPRTPAPPGPVPVVPARDGQRRHARVVLRLRGVPAPDLAATINGVLRAEGRAVRGDAARSVVIVPDAVSNSLIVDGSPDAVDEVRQLVDELDRPAVMVRLEVIVAEVPVGKLKSGAAVLQPEGKKDQPGPAALVRPEQLPEPMEILARAELTTVDNQPAFVQVGRREARVTGVNVTRSGQVNSVAFENVGTKLALTPRVGADQVVTIELDIEDSRLGPLEEGVAVAATSRGEPVRTPNVETMTVQTTLRIPDGQTLLVGGMARQPKSGKQRLILVTPHVLRIGEKAKQGTQSARAQGRLPKRSKNLP